MWWGKYLQNKSILLQTVTQPHKLTVAPTHTGGLLAETHAVSLKDERWDAISRGVEGGWVGGQPDPNWRHLPVNRSRSRCVCAIGRLSPGEGSSHRYLRIPAKEGKKGRGGGGLWFASVICVCERKVELVRLTFLAMLSSIASIAGTKAFQREIRHENES